MRSQRESRLDDQELMKVVEKYRWRDYPAAIAIMIFLITLVILLVAMSFFVMSNAKKALVVIAAMMCSLLFGGASLRCLRRLPRPRRAGFREY